jgi:hypothetical protein
LFLLGALVIFTALLSVAFLHHSVKRCEWLGIALVTVGLVIVGTGDFLFSGDSQSQTAANSIVTGMFFGLLSFKKCANHEQLIVHCVCQSCTHCKRKVSWGTSVLGF